MKTLEKILLDLKISKVNFNEKYNSDTNIQQQKDKNEIIESIKKYYLNELICKIDKEKLETMKKNKVGKKYKTGLFISASFCTLFVSIFICSILYGVFNIFNDLKNITPHELKYIALTFCMILSSCVLTAISCCFFDFLTKRRNKNFANHLGFNKIIKEITFETIDKISKIESSFYKEDTKEHLKEFLVNENFLLENNKYNNLDELKKLLFNELEQKNSKLISKRILESDISKYDKKIAFLKRTNL